MPHTHRHITSDNVSAQEALSLQCQKSNFIRLVGQLVFTPEDNEWETLSEEKQNQYCILAEYSHLDLLFVRYLNTALPRQCYDRFRRKFCQVSVKRMIEHKHFQEVQKLLESLRIKYLPIKGVDLAFRIYPEAALRPHGDWDIICPKNECQQAFQELRTHGWQTSTCSNALTDPGMHHHFEVMLNGNYALEMHWTLPNFGDVSFEEFWQESQAINEYMHVLTPEMNLLLLSAHARSEYYTHLPIWRILLDAGYIMRHDNIDWDKVHQLADKWGILRPDILLAAWSEFFPKGLLPEESLIPEQQSLIRETFSMQENIRKHNAYARSIAIRQCHTDNWFWHCLQFYTNKTSICQKYNLKANQYAMMAFCVLRDFISKALYFLTHFNVKNQSLQDYYQRVQEIDKLAKRRQ